VKHSWLHPAAVARAAGTKGRGIFTTAPLPAGTVVTAFSGFAMDGAAFHSLSQEQQVHSLQIADDLFLASPTTAEDADLFNHSCEPNLGISGSIMLVTLRDIEPGEELGFDYAMCDADDYDEFECLCGARLCRGKVTGNDWMARDLQDRYRGFFSTYLERRIESLRDATLSQRLS